MSDGKICTATCIDGKPCKAISLSNSDLCWAHEPALADKRALAKNLGGRLPTQLAGIPIRIANIRDVMDLISEAVNNIRSMPLSINQAKALLSSCETAMHAIDIIGYEDRLSELEEMIKNENQRY